MWVAVYQLLGFPLYLFMNSSGQVRYPKSTNRKFLLDSAAGISISLHKHLHISMFPLALRTAIK